MPRKRIPDSAIARAESRVGQVVSVLCPHCKQTHVWAIDARDGFEPVEVMAPRVCEGTRRSVVITLGRGRDGR